MRSDPLLDLTGRVALVTGGCGPIGAAVSRGLRERGAIVHALDIDPAVVDLGDGIQGHVADVADTEALERLVTSIATADGGIDILVNNAGINSHASPLEVDQATWDRIFDVNLRGYFVLARAVARVQLERGRPGAIVNVSSTAATTALGRGNLVYGLSKAAVNQLTRELAVEWAASGIRVNAVQPAQVATPAWEKVRESEVGRRRYEHIVAGIPMGRMVEPEELVGPILFLVSPAASMVTGAILPVDGGNLALNASGSLPTTPETRD